MYTALFQFANDLIITIRWPEPYFKRARKNETNEKESLPSIDFRSPAFRASLVEATQSHEQTLDYAKASAVLPSPACSRRNFTTREKSTKRRRCVPMNYMRRSAARFFFLFLFSSFFFSSHFSLTITEPRATGSFGQSILQPGIFRRIDALAPQSRPRYVARPASSFLLLLFICQYRKPVIYLLAYTYTKNPLWKRLEARSVSTRDPSKDYTKSWKKIDRPAVAIAGFTKAIDTIKLAVKEEEADDVWYLRPQRKVLREITAPGNRYDYGEVHKLVKYRTMRVVFFQRRKVNSRWNESIVVARRYVR